MSKHLQGHQGTTALKLVSVTRGLLRTPTWSPRGSNVTFHVLKVTEVTSRSEQDYFRRRGHPTRSLDLTGSSYWFSFRFCFLGKVGAYSRTDDNTAEKKRRQTKQDGMRRDDYYRDKTRGDEKSNKRRRNAKRTRKERHRFLTQPWKKSSTTFPWVSMTKFVIFHDHFRGQDSSNLW